MSNQALIEVCIMPLIAFIQIYYIRILFQEIVHDLKFKKNCVDLFSIYSCSCTLHCKWKRGNILIVKFVCK